jgi:hypothetical protein
MSNLQQTAKGSGDATQPKGSGKDDSAGYSGEGDGEGCTDLPDGHTFAAPTGNGFAQLSGYGNVDDDEF